MKHSSACAGTKSKKAQVAMASEAEADSAVNTAPSDVESKATQAKWTTTKTLVTALFKQRQEGNQAGARWKLQSWTSVIQALAGSEKVSGGIPKGKAAVKGCWQWVCSHHQIYDGRLMIFTA
jgi:hypothetical protein